MKYQYLLIQIMLMYRHMKDEVDHLSAFWTARHMWNKHFMIRGRNCGMNSLPVLLKSLKQKKSEEIPEVVWVEVQKLTTEQITSFCLVCTHGLNAILQPVEDPSTKE